MPVTIGQINQQSTAVLTATEKRAVRLVLREESTVTVPDESDILAAVTALDAGDAAGRQELRAHLAQYKAGQVIIDGGAKAATYDPVLERWGVRNGVRLLLGFTAEPRPVSAAGDAMQLVSLSLASYETGDEWAP
jgi:hypothetical protein